MKLLIGGSPCTHWSIAQTKHRETEPSGLGWELFLNYLIAREKYRPDYFLYENNKSMSPAIRAQITRELGVEPILINSALVSAQSRQRLYWTNIPGVEQPEDRGILVRDILESGVCWKDKAYTLKASAGHQGGPSNIIRSIETNGHFSANGVAEPVNITADGKAQCLRATYYKDGIRNLVGNTIDRKTCVAVRVGDMPNGEGEIIGSQSKRIYSVDGKSVPLQARPNGGGADGAATDLYAVPTGIAWRGRDGSSSYEVRSDQKTNAVTADGHQSRMVIIAAGGKVDKYIGYDAGETRRIQHAMPTDEANQKYKNHYPLYSWGWTREECVRVIERAGLPKPGKSSCFFCPSMKKAEIIDLYENERDLFDRALAIERGAAATLTSVKGLGRKWSWESLIDAYEEEKALDAAQISLFDFVETTGGCICGAPCGCYDG